MYIERLVMQMFNMNNRKTKRIISGIIILLLVFAMLLPVLTYII